MKKDVINVVVTFGLIGAMLGGGSFFYTKKLQAEEETWNIDSTAEEDLRAEQSKIQDEILAGEAEEARLREEQNVLIEVETSTEATANETATSPVPVTERPIVTNTFAKDIAEKQAEYQATQQAILEAQEEALRQKQQQADALAKQLADQKAADALAKQLADQKAAAEKAAAQKKSRRSHAS